MNTQIKHTCLTNEADSSARFYLLLTYAVGILFLLASNLIFIEKAEAANCGGLNQKPCKITFKRLKACDKGLHTNLKTKRCVSNKRFVPKPIRKVIPPKQKNCGKLNQMACRITVTRPKACDFGLHRDRRTFKCVKNRKIIPPKQLNCGKLGQIACKVTPTRLKACNLHLVRDKRTNRCRKIKSVIPRPQANCGKLNQYACKVTVTRPKACDFGLVRDRHTKRCRKIKSVIPPKQLNCGKLNQYACKVTVTRPKACDFGLVRDKHTKRCRKMKSVIPPKQLNCGKLGQYACKVTIIRPKACDFGLHRDKNTRRCVKNQKQFEKQYNCGKLNQVACKMTIIRPKMCDFGLHTDIKTGRCVRNKVTPATIISTAKNVVKESISLVKIMGTGAKCLALNPLNKTKDLLSGEQRKPSLLKELKQMIEDKDPNAALRIASSECLKQVVSKAADEDYNTVTVGVSSGGSIVAVGGFLDTGFAYDIQALSRYYKKQSNTLPVPTVYQTKGGSLGPQLGGGNSLSLGLYKSTNEANPRGSKTQGVTLSAAAVAGVGTGVWFNKGGELDGISLALNGGAEGEAAYNWLTTSTYNLDKPTQISDCGGNGKPACKKWERFNACDAGLRHRLSTGRCVPKIGNNPPRKLLNCGANGQRVCTVQEQVPGCNPGLKIDFKIKRCVYK